MKIKVYAKLSIDERQVKRILPKAVVAGPIQRKDLLSDIDRGYNVVAIIDGRFDQTLSVSPSEITDALKCGLRVYGSSSMGAIRAAELSAFGMVGVGKIYDLILSSPVFRDDFVGQVFSERTGAFKSNSYVDFYFAALRLVEQRRLSRSQAERLCENFSKLYYPDRTLAGLTAFLKSQPGSSEALLKSARTIFQSRYSQKNSDALVLLKTIRSDLVTNEKLNESIRRNQKASQNPFAFYPRQLFDYF